MKTSMERDAEVSQDLVQQIRDEYLEPKGEWAKSRVDRVMSAASVVRGELVLDLGCAFGTLSYHSKLLGAQPVGLDRNEVSLRQGREISLRVGGFVTPRVLGDASSLPFKDEIFDVTINADFIEHTPENDKSEIFSEMFRVTRLGGRGIVYSPNLNRVRWELFGEKIKSCVGLRKKPVPLWHDFVDPDHFGLTTPWKTIRHLRRVGFSTKPRYYEFHIPLLSKLAGFNLFFGWLLSPHFANRFLIQLQK